MKLHIDSEVNTAPLLIKKMVTTRIDDEWKNICHFTYKGVYYVIPNDYEVYSVQIKFVGEDEVFTLLYTLRLPYKDSYKTVLRKEITARIPSTWDRRIIRDWCERETQAVLGMCKVIP